MGRGSGDVQGSGASETVVARSESAARDVDMMEMFHTAPASARSSIETQGLRAADPNEQGNEAGVYLWPSEERAHDYGAGATYGAYDIYAVQVPIARVFEDEVWGVDAGYTPDDIPSSCIKRLT